MELSMGLYASIPVRVALLGLVDRMIVCSTHRRR